MLSNYFKTAWRSILKNRTYTFINVLGLSVALAACLTIFLVVQYETSYDKFWANNETIYQIVTKDIDADGEGFTSGIQFPAIKYLRQDYPQIVFGEILNNDGSQVTVTDVLGINNDKKFQEESGIFYAEPELFKIFEVQWLSGNEDVLYKPESVVLSKSMAEKYFGSWQQAQNAYLKLDNSNHIMQVLGIFEDLPKNSDFPFKLAASYKGWLSVNGQEWGADGWGGTTSSHNIYIKAAVGFNTIAFNHYLQGFQKKHNTEQNDNKRTHFLQPLSNIHFDNRFSNNGDHITTKTTLYTLVFIGLLILLMACINFVNLSAALAVKRSKEVGVRKVMGSTRNQLRLQVYTETLLVVFASILIALFITWLILPYIKYLVAEQNPIALLNRGSVLFLLAVMVVVTILSGGYPAFILSRFKPVEAIKNKINAAKVGSISLRRALVVLQFAFSQILIICTIIAISQMNFINNADLGYNKEAILMVHASTDSIVLARQQAFKNTLLSNKDVQQVSFSYDAPSSENSWQSNFAFDNFEKDKDFDLTLKFADAAYISTYNLQLLAGRFYTYSDSLSGYVVNETFVKKCGLKNPTEAIGKLLRIGGGNPKEVIGVVKDFKLQSMREEVPPIALFPNKKYSATAGIKLKSANLTATMKNMETIWNQFFPEYVFQGEFLHESIQKFYVQEQRLSLFYKICALLAILISCLGLYGLVSFMVVQKTKEVGIRKVLGASVSGIMYLFAKEFTILIVIAFALAIPSALYMMQDWLKNFIYRIDIGIGVFIIAVLVSVVIAWMTVGYKAYKAATVNPVKSLKSE